MYPHFNIPPQKSKYEAIIAYATVVIAGAAVVGLFGTTAPIWLTSLLCVSALIGMGLLITKPVKGILARMRANSVAKARYPQLARLLATFQELADHSHTESIVCVLNLQNQQQAWIGSGIQNLTLAELSKAYAESSIRTIQESGHRYTTFHRATNDLCNTARSFSGLYFVEVMGKLRQNSAAIPEHERRNIESSRERFCAFLDQLDNFCKDTNQAFGTDVFVFHFERPKPL